MDILAAVVIGAWAACFAQAAVNKGKATMFPSALVLVSSLALAVVELIR